MRAPGTHVEQRVGASDAIEADDGGRELVVVRGTRLAGGDPTARIQVLEVDEISARVVTRGEDVARAILHNYPSEARAHRLLQRYLGDHTDPTGYYQRIGTTGLNLRGLGTRISLVLLNGRRVAGAAAQQAKPPAPPSPGPSCRTSTGSCRRPAPWTSPFAAKTCWSSSARHRALEPEPSHPDGSGTPHPFFIHPSPRNRPCNSSRPNVEMGLELGRIESALAAAKRAGPVAQHTIEWRGQVRW